MSYCLNPACSNPNNLPQDKTCQACGSDLLMNERYRASRILGRGGFATTFLAIDESLPGKPSCVIKQLRPVLTAPHILEMSRELFQREASTLGKVGNHPQLPRLLDYFEAEQEFYLIQEYIGGATLQQEVRRSGPFEEEKVQAVLDEVLSILDYLHSQQVIHRDIKPANIIRREIDNKLVLIDFGAVKDQVSQVAMNAKDDDSALTAFAVGTPGFAPPEQMAMRPIYSSDIYSLGVTCLYLLTGKSPKDLNYNPSTGALDWQDQVFVSASLAEVLEKMMAVSVRDRYASAQEASQALVASRQPRTEQLAASMSNGVSAPPRQSGASTGSPTSRLADRIRAQQQRLGTKDAQHQGRRPTYAELRGEGRSAEFTPPRPKHTQKKVTAKTLMMSLKRGERDFSGQDLRNIQLSKCQLSGINFQKAQLQQANFKESVLNKAKLGGATLSSAQLSKAKMIEAYLSYADLEGADLRNADLSFAHLTNANLRGANLCGTNLTGATVSESQLALARTNWATTMPNGKRNKRFGII